MPKFYGRFSHAPWRLLLSLTNVVFEKKKKEEEEEDFDSFFIKNWYETRNTYFESSNFNN